MGTKTHNILIYFVKQLKAQHRLPLLRGCLTPWRQPKSGRNEQHWGVPGGVKYEHKQDKCLIWYIICCIYRICPAATRYDAHIAWIRCDRPIWIHLFVSTKEMNHENTPENHYFGDRDHAVCR